VGEVALDWTVGFALIAVVTRSKLHSDIQNSSTSHTSTLDWSVSFLGTILLTSAVKSQPAIADCR